MLEHEAIRKLSFLNTVEGRSARLKVLAKAIKHKAVGGQELYEITCTTPTATGSAKLAETVTSVFLDSFQEYGNERFRELSDDLSKEVALTSQTIDRLNGELAAIATQRQGSSVDSAIYDPDGEYLTELLKKRMDLVVNRESLNAEKAILSATGRAPEASDASGDAAAPQAPPSAVASSPTTQQVDAYVSQHPEVVRLLNLRSQKNVDRQILVGKGKAKNHPDVMAIDLQLRQIDVDLAKARRGAAESFRQNPTSAGSPAAAVQQQADTRLLDILGEVARCELELKLVDDEIAKQKDRISTNNQLRWQFDAKQRKLDRAIAEHERLLQAESSLHFRKLSLPYQITRQGPEQVIVPDSPVEKYPFKLLGMALAAGLGLPLAVAFLIELPRGGSAARTRCKPTCRLNWSARSPPSPRGVWAFPPPPPAAWRRRFTAIRRAWTRSPRTSP